MTTPTEDLISALIGLARTVDGNTPTGSTHQAMLEGLRMLGGGIPDREEIRRQIEMVHREKAALVPNCTHCASPCGRRADCDMEKLRGEAEDIRALKQLLLLCLQGMAARLDRPDEAICRGLYEGLFMVGEELSAGQLLTALQRLGAVHLLLLEREAPEA